MEYLKISGLLRSTMAVYARFHTLLIQDLGEFQNFARFLMVFLEFQLTKFWGYSSNCNQADRAFTGFPMSSIGGGGGGMWIFSGIAHQTLTLHKILRIESIFIKFHDIVALVDVISRQCLFF